ncbi:MAG: hypothetical protein ACRD72_23830 [Candidatus Angelobacter sp.]
MDTQLTINLTAMDKAILAAAGSAILTGVAVFAKLSWVALTNCIPTIQREVQETNKLLTEMLGYFKAKAEDGKL